MANQTSRNDQDAKQSGKQARPGEHPSDRQGGDFNTQREHNTRSTHGKQQAGRAQNDGSKENLQGSDKQAGASDTSEVKHPGARHDEGSHEDGESRRSGSESGGGKSGGRRH